MADLQTIIARMMGQEEERGQQRRPPQQGRGIFGPGGLQRASRDFQAAFDGAANSVMRTAPQPFINALSDSGIPGWGGLRRARNMADASALGLQAPGMNPVPTGTPLSNALAPPMPQASTVPQAAAQPIRRGREPDSAPAMNMADMENQAWRDAVARARQNIQTEGLPMFTDPATQRAGQAYAQALDQNRAALAEVERRQGVSFEDWWRHRGRQDVNAPPTPEDMDPFRRYRRPLERRR